MRTPSPDLPKPLSQEPDLTGVDIESLPVAPPDPLRELYPPASLGLWTVGTVEETVGQGYWSGLHRVFGMVVLMRRNEMWMSIAPMEIESQQIGVDASRGHVVIFGLGLGWAAAMSALKPEVEKVTVVEADRAVLALHERLKLFERLPGNAGEKVHLVHGDAGSWRPWGEHVDLLIPDIWLEMVSMHRAESVHNMQRRVRAEQVYFWSQELELARYAAREEIYLDDAGIAELGEAWGLPLAGPGTTDYAKRTRDAARQWIKGRWLPRTQVPDYLRSEADDYLERHGSKG